MLSSVHIENIAVVKLADIDFPCGFCAITGETGAGKSVVMDAIKLLCGVKCERELIRHGEDTAEVSGVFSDVPEHVCDSIRELGYSCDDGEILVRRVFSSDGKSSVKINGKSATLSILRGVVGALLDFHGQHESVTLLDKKTHLRMLDSYASNGEALEKYRRCRAAFLDVKKRKKQFNDENSERITLIEILRSQVKEISSLKLKSGEEEKLEKEKKRLENLEKIKKQAGFAYRALWGGEKGNAAMLVDKSSVALTQITDAVPELEEFSKRLKDIYYELEDIAMSIEQYSETEEADPTAMLDRIESRLDAISKIRKKYGPEISDVLCFFERAKARLDTLENADSIAEDIEKEYNDALLALEAASGELSVSRAQAAGDLCKEVSEVLEFLDMPKVRFSVKIDKEAGEDAYSYDGADSVVFMMAQSEADEPVDVSCASGGEISRVMLGLKTVLSRKFGAQTVIYDEIDTGVSGKTARKIGMKLRESAQNAQVICVTHSAQIASMADTHLKLYKETVDGRFETGVTELDREGRVSELSRILGGINVTEAQRQAAADMLDFERGLL